MHYVPCLFWLSVFLSFRVCFWHDEFCNYCNLTMMTLLKKKSPQNSSEGNSCLNWTIFFSFKIQRSVCICSWVHREEAELGSSAELSSIFFMSAEKRLKDYFKCSLAQIHILNINYDHSLCYKRQNFSMSFQQACFCLSLEFKLAL